MEDLGNPEARVKYPLAELIDRYTIVKLKVAHDLEVTERELVAVMAAMMEQASAAGMRRKEIQAYIRDLTHANASIWKLESDIRQGRERKLGLAEVGRRALKIRDWNRRRIAIKNEIIVLTRQGFEDVKIDHASE